MIPNIETIDLSMDDDVLPRRDSQAEEDYLHDLFQPSRSVEKRKARANARLFNADSLRESTQVMSPLPSSWFRRTHTGIDSSNPERSGSGVALRCPQYTNPYPPSTSKFQGQTQLHPLQIHSDCSTTGMDDRSATSGAWQKLSPQKRQERGVDSNDIMTYETPASEDDGRSLFVTPEPVRTPQSSSTLKRPWTDAQQSPPTPSPYFTDQTPSKAQKRTPGSFGSQARKIASGNGYAPSPSVSSSQLDEAHADLIATLNTAQSSLASMQTQLLQPMMELAQRVNVLEEQNKALIALVKESGLVPKSNKSRSSAGQASGGSMRTPAATSTHSTPANLSNRNIRPAPTSQQSQASFRTPQSNSAHSHPVAGGEYGGPKYTGSQTKGSGCFTDLLKKAKEGASSNPAPRAAPVAQSTTSEAGRAKREEYLARERERLAREARDGSAAREARDRHAPGDDIL